MQTAGACGEERVGQGQEQGQGQAGRLKSGSKGA